MMQVMITAPRSKNSPPARNSPLPALHRAFRCVEIFQFVENQSLHCLYLQHGMESFKKILTLSLIIDSVATF